MRLLDMALAVGAWEALHTVGAAGLAYAFGRRQGRKAGCTHTDTRVRVWLDGRELGRWTERRHGR